MINWKPAHSGLVVTVSLAISFLLYFFLLVIPIRVPDFMAAVFLLLPGGLMTAAIDHGHANTPWRIRWHRLVISWLAVAAWFLVGMQLPLLMNNASLGFGKGDVWGYFWPLMLVAAAVAGLGIWLVRWIERGNTALLVIDQPKKKA